MLRNEAEQAKPLMDRTSVPPLDFDIMCNIIDVQYQHLPATNKRIQEEKAAHCWLYYLKAVESKLRL